MRINGEARFRDIFIYVGALQSADKNVEDNTTFNVMIESLIRDSPEIGSKCITKDCM